MRIALAAVVACIGLWAVPAERVRAGDELIPEGAGHFELRGSRATTSDPMRMSQVFFDTTTRNATPVRQSPTVAVASYAGDGHDHWHVNEMMRYDMWGVGGTFRGAKVGFCFLDSDPWATSLPGYNGPYYRSSMCSTNRAILSNRMGISVGWGDEYKQYLAWQSRTCSAPATR